MTRLMRTARCSTLLLCLALPAAVAAQIELAHVRTIFNGTGLEGVVATAVTPDGSHLYAAGRADGTLVAFSRQSGGLLTSVQILRDSVGDIRGIRSISALAVSPDGRHVYAGGGGDDAIVTLRRDVDSGMLEYVDAVFEVGFESMGLDAVRSIVLSADGRHVYTAGTFDTVGHFERNPNSGALTFRSAVSGHDGVDGLEGVAALAISPDDRFLYVAGSQSDTLVVMSRDPIAGTLTPIDLVIDNRDGVDGLNQVLGLAISPDGVHLYAAAYSDNAVSVFARGADSGRLEFVEALHDDEGALEGASAVSVAPNGLAVFVAAFDAASLVTFDRNPADGKIAIAQRHRNRFSGVTGLAGAIDTTVSPDGETLYVAGLTDEAVAVFAIAESVELTAVERNLEGTTQGLRGPRAVVATQDGTNIYVAGAEDAAIVVFARDPDTGSLDFVEAAASFDEVPLGRPVAIAVTPDSEQVMVVDSQTNALIAFDRRTEGVPGTLRAVRALTRQDHNELLFPTDVAVSPDGSQVFVTSASRNALNVIDRAENRFLRFRESFADLDGLRAASTVALSPDGRSVYVGGAGDAAVVHFTRDPATGDVAFVEAVRDDDTFNSLEGISSIVVSGDGRNAYSVSGGGTFGGNGADALTVFERDTQTGALSLLQSFKDNRNGVDGLAGASDITLAGDGSLVFATATDDGAVALFSRTPATGALSFLYSLKDGSSGAYGLRGAAGVSFAPEGAHVFVVASDDSALTELRPVDIGEPGCTGDCDADTTVSISELVVCVNIALGRQGLGFCPACDPNEDGQTSINELVRAVRAALDGCPA